MSVPFCVFIISNGRASNVMTLKTLHKCGYTGPVYIVCDDQDNTIEEYRKNYGKEMILVFDKKHYASLVDSCDNFENHRTTTHARNACFDLAKVAGYEYFIVFDDDYSNFVFNYNLQNIFKRKTIKNINPVFSAMFDFLETDERIDSLCFIQGGDLIGGESSIKTGIFPFRKRKAMNSFFCKTSRRFWFFSRLNEDVNTYLSHGSRGRIFYSIPKIALNQQQTQATQGGMSDAYAKSGTYVKSFYTVMICPSFAKVSLPNDSNTSSTIRRIHHRICWNNAVPKILDGIHKK